MLYRLSYFREVKQDIIEAKNWYSSQQQGLEKRFAIDIKKAALRLRSNPHIHAVRYKKTRVAHPDVFPYAIHFYIDEVLKRVVIIGIVHTSREAEFLRHRK